jgi:hypothetical protein
MSPDPPDPVRPRGALFSPLLEAAVRLAARGHYHQFRKHNTDEFDDGFLNLPFFPDRVPYITHLMGTMCILARIGVRDEVLAASILHDYLEDVPDPDGRESIRTNLGDEVLSLVIEVTEHKRHDLDQESTWEVRKREQLDHLARMPGDAVLIKAADVLHNMQSLLADLGATDDPETVWKNFNAGPERQLWYFTSVIAAVTLRLGEHLLVRDLAQAINSLKPLVPS